ncbi:MAG: hypothetical protein HY042_05345 [Spirochaetia bacterium]|nr:hypothetical protein [Spirochaetia bacterium]
MLWVVGLLQTDQIIKLRMRGRDLGGRLLFETSKILVFRVHDQDLLDESRRGSAKGDTLAAEYSQGNYRCTFQVKVTEIVEDKGDAKGSVILMMPLPGRIRRTFMGIPPGGP